MSDAITKFKNHQKLKDEVAEKRRQRLEDAIPLDGVAGHRPSKASSYDAGFEEGMNKARQK